MANSKNNLEKKSIPKKQPNQNKEIKMADSILFSLFMTDNEMQHLSRPLAPAFKSGIQLFTKHVLNVLESSIPKD